MDAGASDVALALDDGHAAAALGRLDGGLLAGGAAADHDHVELSGGVGHRAIDSTTSRTSSRSEIRVSTSSW